MGQCEWQLCAEFEQDDAVITSRATTAIAVHCIASPATMFPLVLWPPSTACHQTCKHSTHTHIHPRIRSPSTQCQTMLVTRHEGAMTQGNNEETKISTHTHIHTQSHTHTHAITHTHTSTQSHKHTITHTQAHNHTSTQSHKHTITQAHNHTIIHTHVQARTLRVQPLRGRRGI